MGRHVEEAIEITFSPNVNSRMVGVKIVQVELNCTLAAPTAFRVMSE